MSFVAHLRRQIELGVDQIGEVQLVAAGAASALIIALEVDAGLPAFSSVMAYAAIIIIASISFIKFGSTEVRRGRINVGASVVIGVLALTIVIAILIPHWNLIRFNATPVTIVLPLVRDTTITTTVGRGGLLAFLAGFLIACLAFMSCFIRVTTQRTQLRRMISNTNLEYDLLQSELRRLDRATKNVLVPYNMERLVHTGIFDIAGVKINDASTLTATSSM